MSRDPHKPRRKHAPQSPINVMQFVCQKIGEDTIIGAKHLGDNKYEFVLRSPDGERFVVEASA